MLSVDIKMIKKKTMQTSEVKIDPVRSLSSINYHVVMCLCRKNVA